MKTKLWTITTLDAAPAMTVTPREFSGTYNEAKQEAIALWAANPQSMPCVCSHGTTTHYWFMISSSGNWTDKNQVPNATGMITALSALTAFRELSR